MPRRRLATASSFNVQSRFNSVVYDVLEHAVSASRGRRPKEPIAMNSAMKLLFLAIIAYYAFFASRAFPAEPAEAWAAAAFSGPDEQAPAGERPCAATV